MCSTKLAYVFHWAKLVFFFIYVEPHTKLESLTTSVGRPWLLERTKPILLCISKSPNTSLILGDPNILVPKALCHTQYSKESQTKIESLSMLIPPGDPPPNNCECLRLFICAPFFLYATHFGQLWQKLCKEWTDLFDPWEVGGEILRV